MGAFADFKEFESAAAAIMRFEKALRAHRRLGLGSPIVIVEFDYRQAVHVHRQRRNRMKKVSSVHRGVDRKTWRAMTSSRRYARCAGAKCR